MNVQQIWSCEDSRAAVARTLLETRIHSAEGVAQCHEIPSRSHADALEGLARSHARAESRAGGRSALWWSDRFPSIPGRQTIAPVSSGESRRCLRRRSSTASLIFFNLGRRLQCAKLLPNKLAFFKKSFHTICPFCSIACIRSSSIPTSTAADRLPLRLGNSNPNQNRSIVAGRPLVRFSRSAHSTLRP